MGSLHGVGECRTRSPFQLDRTASSTSHLDALSALTVDLRPSAAQQKHEQRVAVATDVPNEFAPLIDGLLPAFGRSPNRLVLEPLRADLDRIVPGLGTSRR